MAKTITINGNKYNVVPMGLNTVCNLDDLGISITDFGKKHMSFVRGYVSLCMGTDVETAGKELEAHIVAGGTIEEIVKAITKEVEESDFFRAISKNA